MNFFFHSIRNSITKLRTAVVSYSLKAAVMCIQVPPAFLELPVNSVDMPTAPFSTRCIRTCVSFIIIFFLKSESLCASWPGWLVVKLLRYLSFEKQFVNTAPLSLVLLEGQLFQPSVHRPDEGGNKDL